MEKDNKITAPEIAREIGVEYNSSFAALISSIKRKKQWVKISDNYNF